MSIFEGPCTASSLESSSSSNTSTASPSIQMVSKSVSERLLGKFFDASQYDFDYEQSGLWSPPIQRRAFLDSPGKICSQDVTFSKLKRADKAWNWRRIFCFNTVVRCLEKRRVSNRQSAKERATTRSLVQVMSLKSFSWSSKRETSAQSPDEEVGSYGEEGEEEIVRKKW
ncbi:hypothetical protein SO802_015182 [Lithocarpus litseifolius]|uniref:Uncharacterized protein n=1 Tax=Lithocarpus litseifolius TaxID=425828 RepID=A0AAW2CYA5_9ROSI